MQGYPGYDQMYAQPQPAPHQENVWPQVPAPGPQYYQQAGYPEQIAYPAPAAAWPSHPGAHASMPTPAPTPTKPAAAAPTTSRSSRTRWLRVIGMLVALALVSFAVYNLAMQQDAAKPEAVAASQPDDEIAALAETPEPTASSADSPSEPAADSLAEETGVVGGGTAPTTSPAVRHGQQHPDPAAIARRRAKQQARRAAQRQQRVRARNAATSLPYTGAEHWIAAILGALLLTTGIAMQRNATRIGESASLYRRGPLLRPLDSLRDCMDGCAHGRIGELFDRVRDAVTSPGQSEYVSSRRRR